nr:tetratricopeptide repeat protein [Candidatus Sigynarchaeota archaeon]
MNEIPRGDEKNSSDPPRTATMWFDDGIEFLKSKKYANALDCFQKAIAMDPNYAKVWFQIGFCLSELGMNQDAIESYRNAIERDPNDEEAWYNLGNQYLNRDNPLFDDDDFYDDGDLEESIKCFEKAVAIKPDFSYAWNNLGFAHSKLGHYQKAIECHQKAVDLDPENESALVNLGCAYYELDDYTKSVEIFEKAVDKYPQNNQAWIVLRASLETYIKKVALTTQNKGAWVRAGKAFLKLGQLQKAIACLKAVIKLDPLNFEAWHAIGFIYTQFKDHKAFMDYFVKPGDFLRDVKKISVISTSQGPMHPDIFWLLESTSDIVIVPSEGPDENFLSQVQHLHEFKNEEVIKAMQSTDDNVFVCWERQ